MRQSSNHGGQSAKKRGGVHFGTRIVNLRVLLLMMRHLRPSGKLDQNAKLIVQAQIMAEKWLDVLMKYLINLN